MTKGMTDWMIGTLVILMAIAIPAGIGLAYWLNDASYLGLSLIAFIIFMAG